MTRSRLLPTFVLATLLALVIGMVAGGRLMVATIAQEATPAPGGGLTSVVLARIAPAAAPDQELQLVRVEVAPGATSAAHTHPGAIALCLESGSVVFGVVEGTVTMTQTATVATPEAATELTAGSETVLEPGDCLSFQATDTVHTLHNPGGPAVIWQAHLYAPDEPPTTFLATPEG